MPAELLQPRSVVIWQVELQGNAGFLSFHSLEFGCSGPRLNILAEVGIKFLELSCRQSFLLQNPARRQRRAIPGINRRSIAIEGRGPVAAIRKRSGAQVQ